MIRAFIAIELEPATIRALGAVQERLRKSPGAGQVKWVAPGSVHLTLKFIGDMDSGRVPAMVDAIRRASAGGRPFRLGLGAPGAFPSLGRPNVVWIGLTGPVEAAAAIARRLEDECAALGFPREERPFAPHLTLGRVRREAGPEERRAIGDSVRRAGAAEPAPFAVDAVCLMRSDLRPSGAVYTELARIRLQG